LALVLPPWDQLLPVAVLSRGIFPIITVIIQIITRIAIIQATLIMHHIHRTIHIQIILLIARTPITRIIIVIPIIPHITQSTEAMNHIHATIPIYATTPICHMALIPDIMVISCIGSAMKNLYIVCLLLLSVFGNTLAKLGFVAELGASNYADQIGFSHNYELLYITKKNFEYGLNVCVTHIGSTENDKQDLFLLSGLNARYEKFLGFNTFWYVGLQGGFMYLKTTESLSAPYGGLTSGFSFFFTDYFGLRFSYKYAISKINSSQMNPLFQMHTIMCSIDAFPEGEISFK
jgi:hypothetical protein